LVAFARKRLRAQLLSRGASSYDIESSKEVLDASALTIGFARRFATYKRATLIFKDLERLASIMLNSKRPVQLIIAGKAHPKDEEGKKLIQDIVSFTKDESLRKRIVFIENYDMNIARYMVEGCDVWLNNPRRPLEASGTSGMKIIANGGLNFSVLDGWWDEAYNYELGWKIGHGEEYENLDYQDEVESSMLYETLENEIVPQFYERGDDKLPRKWLKMMKNSMKTLAPIFNTHRMVRQYATKFYLPAHNNRRMLMANNWLEAKNFMTWKNNIVSNWNAIKFIKVESEHQNGEVKIGSSYKISADIDMPNLTPEDVEVQIYYGKVDDQNIAFANSFMEMTCLTKKSTSGKYKYEGVIDCSKTGQFGYTLRILPKHPLLTNKFELGLIKWA
jgi:starch phosphorylase